MRVAIMPKLITIGACRYLLISLIYILAHPSTITANTIGIDIGISVIIIIIIDIAQSTSTLIREILFYHHDAEGWGCKTFDTRLFNNTLAKCKIYLT